MMSRQSCADVTWLLDRRTETLAESERLLLESHLGACDACRREAAALVGMRELALAAVPQQARSSTRDRVMERVLASAPPSNRAMAPRRPAPWLWVGGGLAVAAAAAAILALVLRRPEETDLRAATETAWPLAAVTLEHGEVFAGNTRLASGAAAPAETLLVAPSGATLRVTHARVALDAGAQVAWLESSQTLHLTTGRATIEGDPTAHRSWRVETARFRVEVVGTRFVVEPERVVVQAGRVRILDLEGEVLVDALGAGGVWTFGREEAAAATPATVEGPPPEIARNALETAPLTDGRRIEVEAVAPVVSAPPAPPPPAPAAPSAGPRPRPRSPASPAAAPKQPPPTLDDVLQEADRLRAAGDARADQLAQPERAAHAFAQVIALGQPPSLIEDAHMRRVEALVHAGRRGEAAAALGAYERAFPGSERAAALRVRLAP